jgi:hypothetical protein
MVPCKRAVLNYNYPNPEYTRIENFNDTISILYLNILLI